MAAGAVAAWLQGRLSKTELALWVVCGACAGDHSATLELSIPSTGEKNTYRLIGRAAEPVAESHLVIECQARSPVTKSIAVPNIVGAPTEYQVGACALVFAGRW